MKFTSVMGAREIQPHIVDCLNEQPARSGMYNWIFAFKGEINTYWNIQDRLEDYDVIQVNMSPMDQAIIPLIRNKLKNSSTKLVLNNDYVCEKWGTWGISPYQYDAVQKMGDMVFGTEPYQVSNMINGSFVIPHPTNTSGLKHLGTDGEEDGVGFFFHWWTKESYIPFRTLELIKKKLGIKKHVTFGYKHEFDEMEFWRKTMFDENFPMSDFPDFAEKVQKMKLLYDPNPCHTYGRNGVEMSCFKKPVIGSNRVFSYNLLTPELTCDPYDCNAVLEKAKFILEQPDKVKEIMDRAYEKVEYFNYDNSRKRFLEALEICERRGGTEWYQKNG